MTPDNERDIQQRIDPALDAHLRDVICRPALSAEQHERIRARIGLSGAASRTTVPVSDRSNPRHRTDDGNATVGPRLDEETTNRGGFSMLPHARERHHNQLFELAAVLAVIIVAVAAFAIYRGQFDDDPQRIGAPTTATATATETPAVSPTATATATVTATATATETEVVVLPTPDEGGMYRNLTVEQVRTLAPFPLQIPAQVPEGLTGPTIMASETFTEGIDEPVIAVSLTFQVSGGFAVEPIEFVQTTAAPQNAPGGDATTFNLAGHQVTRWTIVPEGRQPVVVYTWQIESVHSSISAVLSDSLPETLADSLVSAIFGLEGDAITDESVNDGVHTYDSLTPAEARQIVPMALLFAEPVPAGFNAPVISAEIIDHTDGSESFRTVRAFYSLDGATDPPIEYIQTNQRPQNPPGGDMTTIELAGRTINKALVGVGGGQQRLAIYTWNERGTFATIGATLSDDVTTELLESLVAATVATSPARHTVNVPVFSSGIDVTFTRVSYPDTLDTAPPEGSSYIVVTGTFVNQSIADEGIWRYLVDRLLNPMLFDASSWSYPHQSATITPPVIDLGLDDTATFELVYTVPTGATDLILTFNPDPTTPDDDVVCTIPAP